MCRPGGNLSFFAEPDYGGRIDYPAPLSKVGNAQITSLGRQGADPFIGRKIAHFAAEAGLVILETGIIGYQTSSQQDKKFWENEWQIIRHDLKELIPEEEINRLEGLDKTSRLTGSRILFVPTFYLFTMVP